MGTIAAENLNYEHFRISFAVLRKGFLSILEFPLVLLLGIITLQKHEAQMMFSFVETNLFKNSGVRSYAMAEFYVNREIMHHIFLSYLPTSLKVVCTF